ncbi:MAG: peptidoglycan-binding domain-containing protein, partial [bacterium]
YYFGKVDGKYGKITARAVKDFQDDNDLSTTISRPVTPPTVSDHSPVVISGVSGPQALYVNEQGTWTVTADDTYSNGLHYGVDWGDSPTPEKGTAFSASVQQSATFTHIYSKPGIYNPTFLVTNSNRNQEQGASTSLSVSVRSKPTTFPAGCTSNSGFSPTTERSCDDTVVINPEIPVTPPTYGYQYLPIDSNVSGTVSLVSANEDKVYKFNGSVNPHTPDWKWAVTINNNGTSSKYISRLILLHNISGEGWETKYSSTNPLGKVLGLLATTSTQCTSCDPYNTYSDNMNYLVSAGGSLSFYAYGEPANRMFSGGYLIVEFTDGTSTKISIPSSSITPGTVVSQQPSVTVISPNGGESFNLGNSMNINYSVANLASTDWIRINLVRPGTSFPSVTIASIRAEQNAGSYTWIIPTTTTPASDYEISVDVCRTSFGTGCGNGATDYSNATFSITAQPSLVANAMIKARLSNVRSLAEVVYDTTSPFGYGTASNSSSCTAPSANSLFAATNNGTSVILDSITEAINSSGGASFCGSTTSAWVASVQLKIPENGNNYWCVDSTGFSVGRAAIASGTSCAI